MGADDTTRSESERVIEELAKITTQGTVEYLGRCVVAWSMAERSLETLLIVLLSSRGLPVKDAQITVANLDIRERAKVAIGLAYQAKLPRKRLIAIEGLVNRLSNDLRNRRNRFLHDSWNLGSGLIMKRQSTGTRLVRSKAWQLDLLVPDYEPVKPAILSDFIEDCLKLADAMVDEAQHVIDQAARHLPPTTSPLSESDEQPPRSSGFWKRILRRFH